MDSILLIYEMFECYCFEVMVVDSNEEWDCVDSFYEMVVGLMIILVSVLNNWGFFKLMCGDYFGV